jgi:hypothetical protein
MLICLLHVAEREGGREEIGFTVYFPCPHAAEVLFFREIIES